MAKKPDVSFLGWGIAKTAGKALAGRQLQLKQQECRARGRFWDDKNQKCVKNKEMIANSK